MLMATLAPVADLTTIDLEFNQPEFTNCTEDFHALNHATFAAALPKVFHRLCIEPIVCH
jgi:hypothetical protein